MDISSFDSDIKETSMPGQRWAVDEDRRRRLMRGLRWTVGGLALVIVLAGALLVFETFQARGALTRAEGQARELRHDVSAGNVDAARSKLAAFKDSTRDAQSHTNGPLWYLAARTPFVGKNFAAIHEVSRVLRSIGDRGLPPLVDIADQVNADVFSPRNARIDIQAVRTLAPGLQEADRALSAGWRDLATIDADELVGALQGPVKELQANIDDARSAVGAGAKAARLIPEMLGGSGGRSYVLAFQNNAEIRSTGGLPGAFAILKAKNGKLTLGGQGAGSDFKKLAALPLEPTADENKLYSVLLTGYWGDTTLTPDFPRSAEIMRAMVRRDRGKKTDGVISLDPVALSHILAATGPVTLADGSSLTSKNAVRRLLSDVYRDVPGDAAQNAFFADASSRAFAAVVSGRGGSQALLEGLAKGVDENRIMIESARQAEQRVLASTRIAGALPTGKGTVPHVGVYYNDATQTKLEYYLRRTTTVTATTCTADGAQTLRVNTRLRSTAPKDVKTMPEAVLGGGTGEKPGSFRMIMAFYAPYGGLVTRLDVDGKEQPLNRFTHDGLNVVTTPVLLAPGQQVTVKASMFSGKGQRDDAMFATTPGIESVPNSVAVPSACD